MVNIKIEFNGQILTLPVNPENIEVTREADNEKVKVIGLGPVVIKKDEGLSGVSIDSFFPSSISPFYTGVKPKTCIEFINTIWKSEKVAKIVTEGLPVNVNMYFVINNFNYDSRAGEEEDIYYTLDITKYVPYGAKVIEIQLGTRNGIVSTSNRVDTSPSVGQTYTVVSGDTLIGITKKLIGDTSRWGELYDLNKGVIGGNPNLIYPGQVLSIPGIWNGSPSTQNVAKTSSASSSNINNSSKTSSNNSKSQWLWQSMLNPGNFTNGGVAGGGSGSARR